jgi:hypothetical protein
MMHAVMKGDSGSYFNGFARDIFQAFSFKGDNLAGINPDFSDRRPAVDGYHGGLPRKRRQPKREAGFRAKFR